MKNKRREENNYAKLKKKKKNTIFLNSPIFIKLKNIFHCNEISFKFFSKNKQATFNVLI